MELATDYRWKKYICVRYQQLSQSGNYIKKEDLTLKLQEFSSDVLEMYYEHVK